MRKDIHKVVKNYWDETADEWFGATCLPKFGVYTPTEDDLQLFGDVKGLNMLDIGCGSGHSLLYHSERGAKELWGLDMSTGQIENAKRFLSSNGVEATFINAPMEQNEGIPKNHFDIVYSIYAIGWTTDLDQTFSNVYSYLKEGGRFIFSWDHPMLRHMETRDTELVIKDSYFNEEWYTFKADNMDLKMCTRKISTYINALTKAGFIIEKLIEESDKDTKEGEATIRASHYSPHKAKLLPHSFIIKARK